MPSRAKPISPKRTKSRVPKLDVDFAGAVTTVSIGFGAAAAGFGGSGAAFGGGGGSRSPS